MFKFKKIIFSISVVISIGIYFNITSIDTEVKKNHIKTNVAVESKQNKKTLSNVAYKKERIQYTKVALPKDIRELEHSLIDIQNNIIKDEKNLNNEIKLNNNKMRSDIKKANSLIKDLNKKLKLSSDEISMLDDSYNKIMGDLK